MFCRPDKGTEVLGRSVSAKRGRQKMAADTVLLPCTPCLPESHLAQAALEVARILWLGTSASPLLALLPPSTHARTYHPSLVKCQPTKLNIMTPAKE